MRRNRRGSRHRVIVPCRLTDFPNGCRFWSSDRRRITKLVRSIERLAAAGSPNGRRPAPPGAGRPGSPGPERSRRSTTGSRRPCRAGPAAPCSKGWAAGCKVKSNSDQSGCSDLLCIFGVACSSRRRTVRWPGQFDQPGSARGRSDQHAAVRRGKTIRACGGVWVSVDHFARKEPACLGLRSLSPQQLARFRRTAVPRPLRIRPARVTGSSERQ